MAEMTVIFEGMAVTARSAEDLIEIAKAKRALSNGHSSSASISPSKKATTIEEFMIALPSQVVKGFEALLKNKGNMTAEELWPVFEATDNSLLGARFISPVRRVAKNHGFESERVLKKVLVTNSKGEVGLKYKIPQENMEQVKQGLEKRDSNIED